MRHGNCAYPVFALLAILAGLGLAIGALATSTWTTASVGYSVGPASAELDLEVGPLTSCVEGDIVIFGSTVDKRVCDSTSDLNLEAYDIRVGLPDPEPTLIAGALAVVCGFVALILHSVFTCCAARRCPGIASIVLSAVSSSLCGSALICWSQYQEKLKDEFGVLSDAVDPKFGKSFMMMAAAAVLFALSGGLAMSGLRNLKIVQSMLVMPELGGGSTTVVTSSSIQQSSQQGAYPPQQPTQYPPQQSYPQQFPPQQGYPPQQGGYPPQQGGFPPQKDGFPPQKGGYSPQQAYPGYASQGGFAPPYEANDLGGQHSIQEADYDPQGAYPGYPQQQQDGYEMQAPSGSYPPEQQHPFQPQHDHQQQQHPFQPQHNHAGPHDWNAGSEA